MKYIVFSYVLATFSAFMTVHTEPLAKDMFFSLQGFAFIVSLAIVSMMRFLIKTSPDEHIIKKESETFQQQNERSLEELRRKTEAFRIEVDALLKKESAPKESTPPPEWVIRRTMKDFQLSRDEAIKAETAVAARAGGITMQIFSSVLVLFFVIASVIGAFQMIRWLIDLGLSLF